MRKVDEGERVLLYWPQGATSSVSVTVTAHSAQRPVGRAIPARARARPAGTTSARPTCSQPVTARRCPSTHRPPSRALARAPRDSAGVLIAAAMDLRK